MIDVIVLAAGKSSRYEGKGNKLLVDLCGKTVIERSLDSLKEQGFINRILVSDGSKDIQAIGQVYGYHTLINKHQELGISHSIELGVSYLEKIYEKIEISPRQLADYQTQRGILFIVADQPLIAKETISKLCNAYKMNTKIVCVETKNRIGNPSIFNIQYIKELKKLTGDKGGMKLIKKYPDQVTKVYIENPMELEDVDTLNKMNAVKNYYNKKQL